MSDLIVSAVVTNADTVTDTVMVTDAVTVTCSIDAVVCPTDVKCSRPVNLQFCYTNNKITHFTIVKDHKYKKYDMYNSDIGMWLQIPVFYNREYDFLNQSNFASHTIDNLLNIMVGTYKYTSYDPKTDYLSVDLIIPLNEWIHMADNPYYVVEIIDDTLYPLNTNNAVCGIKIKKSFGTYNLATAYSNELKCQIQPFRVEICKVNEWVPLNKNKSIFDNLANFF